MDALSTILQATQQTLGAIASLHSIVTDIQISNLEEETQEHEDAMRKQWEAQTALSIAQAALNIPLAISQAAAGPWPAAIGFMIAAGTAATLGLVGVIAKAAQGPQFHMGGDVLGRGVGPGPLPDEVNATLLAGERVQSRAEVRNGGAPTRVTTVFQVGPRTVDAMVQEATRTGAGATYDALRANRPRRIGRARIN
jgi:hypothetical protein